MKSGTHSRIAGLAVSVVIAACGGAETVTGPVVASISVSPSTDTLIALGATRQLAATALDASGNPTSGVTISWNSAQPTVASVTSSGLVAAVGNGQALITASAAGITGSATVTVAQEVASVTVAPPGAALTSIGATQQFTASAKDANNNAVAGVKFLWLSSDQAVATIDTNGLATARRAGLVTVTAAARGVPGHASLGVTQTGTQLAYRVPPPPSTVAGEPFATAVQVEIRDANGAILPDAQLPVTLTSSGGALHGTTTVNAINGVASFSGLWIEAARSGITLTAASGSLTNAVSPSLAITPAARVAVQFVAAPATDTAGALLGVVARLRDRFGNTDTSARDTVRVKLVANAAGGALFGDTVAVASGGVASFASLNLHLAGTGYTLRAFAAGMDSALSGPFGVTPASPRSVTLETEDTVANVANNALPPVQVAIRDTFRNVVETGTHDVTLTLARVPWPPAAILGPPTQPSVGGYALFTAFGVDRPANGFPGFPYTVRASSPGLRADSMTLYVLMVPTAIAAGGQHTCAFALYSSSLYCWGANGWAQLGSNAIPATGDSAPALVDGGLVASKRFSAGLWHTCMLTDTDEAYCWGGNDQGQLGYGSAGTNWAVPIAVTGGHTWLNVSAGGHHTCGIDAADSTAYCWGDNSLGQLGNNDAPNDQASPSAVYGGRKYSWIATGQEHTCAIALADSTAYCWGQGIYGELGHNAFAGSDTAVAVTGGLKFATLGLGFGFTCGVSFKEDTNVHCWGENGVGQLGSNDSPSIDRAVPDTVDATLRVNPFLGSEGFAQRLLTVGWSHACAVRAPVVVGANDVLCWGGNVEGEVGPNGGSGSAVPVLALDGTFHTVGQVAAGAWHTCAYVTGAQAGYDSGVFCWGRNSEGQLGIGSTTGTSTPTRIIQ